MNIRSIIAALLLSTSIHVCAQTFFDVTVTGSTTEVVFGTTSISADGVDGGTTYVQVAVQSLVLEEEPTTTFTLVTALATFTNTFVADASGFRLSESFVGEPSLIETCVFSANRLGTCVEERPSGTRTGTETFSGTVVPFYTLAAVASTSGSASSSSMSASSTSASASSGSSGSSPGNAPVPPTGTNPIPTPTTSASQNGAAPLSASPLRLPAFFTIMVILILVI
ncbi:hypothetical protein C8R44DRAFT_369908 [Mycena epipterygia]|nr:hypothetical protein C8R44DRAFT_369908 [Mycena epipterygia]